MIVLQMYVWMFCQWTSSVPRGKQFSKSVQLKENSELWGADNVQRLSKHIFAPNEGNCVRCPFKYFFLQHTVSKIGE